MAQKPSPKATKVVKSTQPKSFTMAQIMSAVTSASKANSVKGVKSFYRDGGAKVLAKAVAKAMTIPTLASEGIHTINGIDPDESIRIMAQRRRDFARRHKAIAVNGDEVLLKNTTDRTENAIRIRLRGIEQVLGLPENTFYAVRANAYRKGEKSDVYVVRK